MARNGARLAITVMRASVPKSEKRRRKGGRRKRRIDTPRRVVSSDFPHTWFNLDFQSRLAFSNLSRSSNPSIPRLPDSITSWAVNMFTVNQNNDLCMARPYKFSVYRKLYIKLVVPSDGLISVGDKFFVDIVVYSYETTSLTVKLHIEPTNGICVESGEGTSVTLPSSDGDVASVGSAKFILLAYNRGLLQVSAKMEVEDDGRSETQARPLLVSGVDTRHVTSHVLARGRGGDRAARDLVTSRTISFAVPAQAVPGSYQVTLAYHGISSIAMERVDVDEDSDGIEQHLYGLRNSVSRYNYLVAKNLTTDENLEELRSEAETSANGLMAFLLPYRAEIGGLELDDYLGFSYTTWRSQPDLWLSAYALRLMVEARHIVTLDQNVMGKVLHFIIIHARNTGVLVEKEVDIIDLPKNRREKELNRQTHETAMILSEMNQVFDIYEQESEDTDSIAFIAQHYHVTQMLLKICTDAVRETARSRRFRRRATVEQRLAAIHAVGIHWSYKLPKLEASIIQSRRRINGQENRAPQMWIDSDKTWKRATTKTFKGTFDHKRLNVELTSKWILHSLMTSGQQQDRIAGMDYYATWLVDNRGRDGTWVSARDTLMAMEALALYAIKTNHLTPDLDIRLKNGSWFGVNPVEFGTESSDSSSATQLSSNSNSKFDLKIYGLGLGWIKARLEYDVETSPDEEQERSSSSSSSSNKRSRRSADVTSSTESSCAYAFTPQASVFFSGNATATASGEVVEGSKLHQVYKMQINPIPLPASPSSGHVISDGSLHVIEVGLKDHQTINEEDLNELSNAWEKRVEHYKLTSRNLIFYVRYREATNNESSSPQLFTFPSFAFRITAQTNHVTASDSTIPIYFYPLRFKGLKCVTTVSLAPIRREPFLTRCESASANPRGDSVCLCANKNACAKRRKPSTKTTVEKRHKIRCDKNTGYAYQVTAKKWKQIGKWQYMEPRIDTYLLDKPDPLQSRVVHQFWMSSQCQPVLKPGKSYLVMGGATVTTTQRRKTIVKHLLDGSSWVERWPTDYKTACGKHTKNKDRKICKTLYTFSKTASKCS